MFVKFKNINQYLITFSIKDFGCLFLADKVATFAEN